MRTTAGLTWQLTDHHNTAEVNVDSVDLSVTQARRLPFGNPRGGRPAVWAGDKGFLGGTGDNTGLTHLGAREYDPSLGRFVSVDPVMDLASPQQWNGYVYANDNPVTVADLSGLAGVCTGSCASYTAYYTPARWKKAARDFINRTACPSCRLVGDRPQAGEPIIHPIAWAEAHEGMPFAQISPNRQERALHSWWCYYNADDCIAERKAQEAGLKQFYKEITGIADAERCLDGKASGCFWTGINFIGVAGVAVKGGTSLFRAARAADKLDDFGDAARICGGCLCSFSGDTRVQLADGTTKRIKDLKVGDKVLATGPETGEKDARTVTAVWVHNDQVLDLVVDGEHVTTTEDHSFWNDTDQRWQRADALGHGD